MTLSFGEQLSTYPPSPYLGRDEQVLQFGLNRTVANKDRCEAHNLFIMLRDDDMWQTRGRDFSRFWKCLQFLNMISPSQRRPQFQCSEGIPVLLTGRSNENYHYASHTRCSHHIKSRFPFRTTAAIPSTEARPAIGVDKRRRFYL